MKLLTQIIQKKLSLRDEFMLKKQYPRAIWNFYCVYNICLAVAPVSEEKKIQRKRDRYWKMVLTKINEKKFKKFNDIMNRDMRVIIRALNKLDKSQSKEETLGDLDRPYCVGMSAFEFPQ